MIDILLWDVDGTLLDFLAAERNALRACFAAFGLGACTDEMIGRYSVINQQHWRRLERGEITRAQTLYGRFAEFFRKEGIGCRDVDAFNLEYQKRLGDTVVFFDQADRLIASLRGRVRQYAVTNGTREAQMRKLTRSGLDALFDGVFISELVGADKPSVEFFDAVFREIGPVDRARVMIVGDSLTSDIRGGNNAGVRTCWYNPQGLPAPADLHIDAEIQNLNEIVTIL